ncbi:hypothetical protein SCAR479_11335 [Seiridium cardinale]|uniref:Uncharacterized protein n=1 Tax=Seiridium cardinale TaxID=138064 RepID=A0ABR2XEI1_9PEZI
MNSPTYFERRYRTLYSPDALNFAARQPRSAVAAIYSPAPTGIHCGLPKGALVARNSTILLTRIAPVALVIFLVAGVVAASVVTYFESGSKQSQTLPLSNNTESLNPEALRRKRLIDAYGDRESLERLAEVTAVYEATR